MRVLEGWAVGDEAVFDALIQGGDFGVAQADVVCEEGLCDVGEEVGAVDGGDIYGVPAGIIFFGGDDYGRWNGDVADAAADVWAATLFLDGGIAVDEAVEFGFECALAVGIFFGREIVGKLEDKGVEDVVVLGNEGAGGLDVEAVAAENAAETCEEAVAVGHEDHDLKAVALGEDAAADGRTLGIVGEVCGVPEDFPRLMADVVCAAEDTAEFLLVFEGNGCARELVGRGLFASVGKAFGIVVFAV